MADQKKISELPLASSVSDGDVFVGVQDGVTRRTAAGSLRSYILKNARVNVLSLGAKGDGVTDDFGVFQAAINLLPAGGGTIEVPDATYLLSAVPAEGVKSISWLFGPATVLTGAGVGEGKFGYMTTNPAQLAVGPYYKSRSSQHSTNANGGIAALNAEMLQPADYVGQSVAAYFGAVGSNPTAGANVWALNTLVRAQAGALGTYQCIEVDVDNFAAGALVKGISISGAGTVSPKVALEILRANDTPWLYGLDLLNCVTGLRVRASTQTTTGIVVGAPSDQLGAVLTGKLLANGDDGILLERFTDTSPTGNFLRAVNAANNANLFSVAASGSVNSAGSITAAVNLSATTGNVTAPAGIAQATGLEATGALANSSAGAIRISASTRTTVGAAGGGAALPATPVKYLAVSQNGVNYLMPLYTYA